MCSEIRKQEANEKMNGFEAADENEAMRAILSYMREWSIARRPTNDLSKHEARKSDVIITTFPKAGTTLTQQMTYQVLVASGRAPRGDPTGEVFSDICDVAPWINYSAETAKGYETTPRLYKSHSPSEVFQIGSQRHIIVMRDPAKFPASWLDFMTDKFPRHIAHRMYDLGRPVIDAAFKEHVLAVPVFPDLTPPLPDVDRRWFHFAESWLKYADRHDVLVLFYEDVIADLESTANVIAAFIGVELSKDALPTIVHRCSRDYMAEGSRFKSVWDAHFLKSPPLVTKVQKDRQKTFARFPLTDDQRAALSDRMRKAFHVDSYEQLKKKISDIQRKKLAIIQRGVLENGKGNMTHAHEAFSDIR